MKTISMNYSKFFNQQGKLNLQTLAVIFIILLLLIGGVFLVRRRRASNQVRGTTKIIDQIEIGKQFEFAGLHPENRKPVTEKISFTIISAEKTDQIVVKNKLYKPPQGRVFLSLNLELKNESTQELGFFSRNLVRLMIDDKPFAPQFYNRGITVAPIAIKKDKLGFTVETKQKEFKLQVGELTGEKEIVELKFQR